jgi:hypothetical protein
MRHDVIYNMYGDSEIQSMQKNLKFYFIAHQLLKRNLRFFL